MRLELRIARTAALVLAGIVPSACFPGLGGGGDYPDAGIPSSLPEGATDILEDEVSTYSACANRAGTFAEERLIAVTAELSTRDDGVVEVPLSTDGCVRFRREIEGGSLRSAEFFVFTGEITVYITDDSAHYAAYTSTIARWERDAGGTLTGHLDSDLDAYDRADTFREVETIERDGYYRVTRTNEASGEVEWRMTLERTAEGDVQTTEQLTDGALQVFDRTIVDIDNEAGGAPSPLETCAAARTSCDGPTTAALDTAMVQALARGTNCMAGLSQPGATYQADVWSRLQALKNVWTRAHTWACMPVGCTYGHWCPGCGAGGADQIDIGYTDWMALPANQQLGTLFHELMHGVLGDHSDVVVNSDITSRMRRYVDRVDACEAYCFGSAPTRCACATCLDVRACDSRCAGLASCLENDCSGAGGCVATMSEAVGAACVTTNAAGEETATWSPTMAACRMGCAALGGTCRSYSRSCEPGCE